MRWDLRPLFWTSSFRAEFGVACAGGFKGSWQQGISCTLHLGQRVQSYRSDRWANPNAAKPHPKHELYTPRATTADAPQKGPEASPDGHRQLLTSLWRLDSRLLTKQEDLTRGVSGSRLYNYPGFLVEGLGGSGASGFVEIRGSVYRGLTPSYCTAAETRLYLTI